MTQIVISDDYYHQGKYEFGIWKPGEKRSHAETATKAVRRKENCLAYTNGTWRLLIAITAVISPGSLHDYLGHTSYSLYMVFGTKEMMNDECRMMNDEVDEGCRERR
jgi:hypothetical protein